MQADTHNPTQHRIAVIEWVDAFGCPAGWEFEDETQARATTVRSVGFVLSEDDQVVMLAPHISSPGEGERRQLAGHIAVPRRQIVKIEFISSSLVPCDQVLESVPSQLAS